MEVRSPNLLWCINPYVKSVEVLYNMISFMYSFKDFERKYTFSDEELRGLYNTFSLFILRGLKQFRPMCAPPMSIIASIRPDVTLLNMTDDYKDPNSDISKAQIIWDKIYDKMLYAFQAIVNDDEEYNSEYIKEGLELFAKYFTDLWN